MGMVYANPEQMARHANAPVRVCNLVFAVAEDDPDVIRLVRGPSFDAETLRLRRAVIWTARMREGASYPEIGRALNRDHSSIVRLFGSAVVAWCDDLDFRALCDRITRNAGSGVEAGALRSVA